MNKQQARKTIAETFENPFEKSRFTGFVKNLLNRIDEGSFIYKGNYIPDAYKQYIKTLERIGKFSDGENSLDILVITLQKETSLDRARTMQRNFIAWYLNGSRGGEMKDGALVTYVSPDQTDWRFSLVKMDYTFEKGKSGKMKVKEEFTPARRWSFLVGTNEKSHTAQSRLVNILADDDHAPTLAELENAFDIETVTKEFFLKYRELFLRTKEALDKVVRNDLKIKADFEAKGVDTVNFAKKLLGQIVFLYFLQKKGWFGVGRDDDWGTGSKHFLRSLFENKHGGFTNFFNDILEPLFYEALRIDRSHDDDYYSRFNCKIPFLNGGLFDPIGNYDWVHADINLPNDLFSNSRKTKEGDEGDGILDVFDRYNFTVREDEPLEKEVAIDPELLGKAYEKFNAIRPDNFDEFTQALKSGKKGEENKFNKKFGVYYTPREIVHYMCKQSLIQYLASALDHHKKPLFTQPASQLKLFGDETPEQQLLAIDSDKPVVSRQDIEDLIEVGEMITEHEATALIKEEKIKNGSQKSTEYTTLLPDSIRKNAKIIDDMLADITVCDPAVGSGAFPVGMMNEIVRARNVLSVFLKEDRRSDYEFKRRCIEHSLYGVDIDPGAVEIAKLRLWLSLVVDEEDIKNIKPLPNLDYKIVCGNSLLGVEKDLFNQQLFSDLEKLKPLFFKETNPTRKQEYKKQIDGLICQITKGHTEFDFEVYFSEVFHEKGGFDVVIANPPYIGESGHKEIFRLVAKGPLGNFYHGKMDYLYFFFHLALKISKTKAACAFITTNYFITATGAKKLRLDFKNNAIIRNLVNFNELKIFESALGQHNMITIFSKSNEATALSKNCITQRKGLAETNILFDIVSGGDAQTSYYEVTQSDLYDGKDLNIRLFNISDKANPVQNILKKIQSVSYPLGEQCLINQGIVTGANFLTKKNKLKYKIDNLKVGSGIFLVTNDELQNLKLSSEERALVKPIFKNSDISKYYTKSSNEINVINIRYTDRLNIDDYPRIKNHLLTYKKLLLARPRTGTLESAFSNGYWYVMTTSRRLDFESPKIVVPYRSSSNIFGYNEIPWYGLTDIYFITSKNTAIQLKYVLALLNSKLYFLWLYHKGKRKGEILELFYEPLSEIPIKIISGSAQKPFIDIVDQILAITKEADYLQNPAKQAQVGEYERQIDQMVYELYGLTEEEIKIVEGESK